MGHYVSLINWKGCNVFGAVDPTQVAIGVACYGPSGVTDKTYYENYPGGGNGVCLVIEMLYPRG